MSEENKLLCIHLSVMCVLLFVSLTLWKETDHIVWGILYSGVCFKGIMGYEKYIDYIKKGNTHTFKKMISIVWFKLV